MPGSAAASRVKSPCRFRQALPYYLQPDVWPELRRHLDRLTLFEGSIDDAARETERLVERL